MLLIGVGAGLGFPSLMTVAMSGATPSEAGLASGLVNTSMQVGGALGLAVLATLSSSRVKDVLAGGGTSSTALASGLHLALAVGAGLVISAIAIGGVVLTSARPAVSIDERELVAAGAAEELYSEAP